MAVYKVPQDVEAEDKFLGPLTFKQFLFGGGVVITGYLMFLLVTKGAAFIAIIILPFFTVFTALAFPWGKDQPTEIWLAGRFRYMFFPRTRIWDQSGAKDLVTITVPKREEHIYSDGLEQDQVKSRFDALASVVDSRGWAVKNATPGNPGTDRLTSGSTVPANKDASSATAARDVFDKDSSPLTNQFDSMIKESETTRRQATLSMVDSALHPPQGTTLPQVPSDHSQKTDTDYWFKKQAKKPLDPGLAKMKQAKTIKVKPKNSYTPGQNLIEADLEKEALKHIHKKNAKKAGTNELGRIKTIQPVTTSTTNDDDEKANATSTTPVDPGILVLAHNDDLNVETIQRQANKNNNDNEVIVDLR